MTMIVREIHRLRGLLAILLLSSAAARADQAREALESRLQQATAYLASDLLEGRAIGSKGLDLAAEYVAAQFAAAGLRTDRCDKGPFQRFTLPGLPKLGPQNSLVLQGPGQRIELRLGEDFTPLSPSASGKFDLPLVFVGYGITAQAEKFDEYAGVDVKGKLVVIVRKEPEQANPKSAFNGTATSPYATFRTKIDNAQSHQAAAVLFCTDRFTIDRELAEIGAKLKTATAKLAELERDGKPTDEVRREIAALKHRLKSEEDPLLAFNSPLGGTAAVKLPVLQCRRAVIDRVLQAVSGRSLAQWEAETDRGPTPHPVALPDWRGVGRVDATTPQVAVRNVIGVIDGRGALAGETIVVGAHYDHIGRGQYGSLAGSKEVHPGADDNASGTAVLIETAQLAAEALKKHSVRRQVLFIAFTGEERGFLGSRHYVEHPLAPLAQTVAMVNFDMVGRLREDRLMTLGADANAAFAEMLERANQPLGLKLIRLPAVVGPSDQFPFHKRGVPALSFFTGLHGDYHRPSDTADKLNVGGMATIALLAHDVIANLASVDPRPASLVSAVNDRPFLGVALDNAIQAEGVALSDVVNDGPAQQAGLRPGDVLLQLNTASIRRFEDLDRALRAQRSGDRVRVRIRRSAAEQSLEVTLGPPR